MPEARHKDDDPLDRLRARAWRWGGAVLVLAMVVYSVFGADGLLRQYQRFRDRERLTAVLTRERARNEHLRREVDALRKQDLAIESAIREELDFQRPGEIVLIVEPDDPLAVTAEFDSLRGAP